MNEEKPAAPADALIQLLKSSLTTDGPQSFAQVVLYTSFGVVRGRIGHNFGMALRDKQPSDTNPSREVIELDDATVEHYSNHLATASFSRIYVRLKDAHGFALL
ncbi:MAG TPA: hypothetical protein VJZ26_09775 [Blastocatellia bacterium]|nr:hypothetical protein [Blastocatellia bacterium]